MKDKILFVSEKGESWEAADRKYFNRQKHTKPLSGPAERSAGPSIGGKKHVGYFSEGTDG